MSDTKFIVVPKRFKPTELPPNAELTNDPTQWEERSRPATEWEMQEEYEAGQHRSPFG